ncbi:MAG TPA: DUF1697 domain-containing protein [Adhaeribacter sp.]|nr:DUF1697 domain-containing protein [Adhaeribacter sp.]
MQTYIAIIRGINVSGKHKVPMAELKPLCESLGWRNVRTYIQSGNVIFETDSPENLAGKLEEVIAENFGFKVPVIIRTALEMAKVVAANPYAEMVGFEPEKLYVTFMAEAPQPDKLEAIKAFTFEPEMYSILGKEIYIYCFNGYGNTKLENSFFEKKLKVTCTTRNWRTVNKLVEMSLAKD